MNLRRRPAGFSLLEVLIAIGILALVMGTVYMSLFRTSAQYEVNSTRAWIVDQARITLDEMAEDIRHGNQFSLSPNPGLGTAGVENPTAATSIAFLKAIAPTSAGVPQYTTNVIRYLWEPSSGPTAIDANNNGVVDEGRIVRIDENGKRRVMCNYVNNNSDPLKPGLAIRETFRITSDGVRQVQLRITLNLILTDSTNKVLLQQLETKVFMRNSR